MSEKTKVVAFLSEDNRHSKYLIKGLTSLRDREEITLEFRHFPPLYRNRFVINGDEGKRVSKDYPWCPELLISNGNKQIRIGIDLQDWSNYFSYHAIRNCRIIYKRALESENREKYAGIIKTSLLPFGPNHNENIEEKAALTAMERSRRNQNFLKAIRNPIKVFRKLGNKASTSSTKHPSANYTRELPPFPYVFFQVQCHNWSNNSFAAGLNEFRAELIRAFRKELGERFQGGMFFSGEIHPDFSDCITRVDPDPENYKRFVQAASVLISTNGFGDSIPWKLTEYLKWGSVIVSQKPGHLFRTEVPQAAMIQFDTVQEALDAAKKLLDNRELRIAMSAAARQYYEQEVEPSHSVKAILEDALIRA